MKKYRIRSYNDGGVCAPDEIIDLCTLDSETVEAESIDSLEVNKIVMKIAKKYVKDVYYCRHILMDPSTCHHIDFGSYNIFIQVKEIK